MNKRELVEAYCATSFASTSHCVNGGIAVAVRSLKRTVWSSSRRNIQTHHSHYMRHRDRTLCVYRR